jgi:hypothetical protein
LWNFRFRVNPALLTQSVRIRFLAQLLSDIVGQNRRRTKMIKTIGFILALLVTSVASVSSATTLKQEPPMGAMREGQVVLVDDGSCPSGQIKRVVGGNHTKVGGTKQVIRQSSCVPR